MTPFKKALELIDKFDELDDEKHCYHYIHNSKQCALIAVDEIIKITSESYDIDHINWWKEVKKEIEAL
jgi:dimeric dUTPase (all-alpha-NTP-PPase superfamily)